MSFRFRRLADIGDSLSVRIEPDAGGFLGRECPIESCELYFKVKPGTGLTGPDLPCVCPYCGHKAGNDQFFTKDQIEYAQSVAFREISDAIGEDLKQLEFRSPPGAMFGISMTVTQGDSPPIAYYREQALETHLKCSTCTLEYAVFGLFGFCPDCGLHNSMDILRGNLDLVGKQVALALTQDDPALRRHLLEDALENCVSAFDGFGREALRVAHKGSGTAPSVSFQNLERAADRVQQLHGIDMRSAVAPETWTSTQRGFMKRHLLSHRAGVVDDQYLSETADPSARRGHRVVIGQAEVEATASALIQLGEWLVSKLELKAC